MTLTVNDACGSTTATTTVTITEVCPPTANAGGPYSDEVCPGDNSTITFAGSGSGTDTLTYDWDFGDGNTDDDAGPSPSHTYLNPDPFDGSPYTVTLTVNDACGSTVATTTVTITECINQAPEIGDIPIQKISVTACGSAPCYVEYQYTLPASDPDDDNLTFTLVPNKYGNIPSGMTINSVGVIDGGNEDWVKCCCYGERCHRCCTVWVKVKVEDDGCCQSLVTYVEFPIEIWYGWLGYENGKKVYGRGFDNCPFFCN